MFGISEHRQQRSQARSSAARRRISAWLDSQDRGSGGHKETAGPAGLVLTGPAAVAWATGGIAPPVDRTAAVDLVWAVFTPASAALVTTNVEAARIRAEYDPAAHGFTELAEVPWYSPGGFALAAAELAAAAPSRLASDGHPAFGFDAGDELISLRLALSAAEVDDLAELGHDAAHALQSALTGWQPGERDLDLQARCAALIEAAGADAPVLIVGGDDRLASYRHPMAIGAPVLRLAMVVVVARRHGLHVALTRFASAGPVDRDYAALRARVLAIEDAVLTASAPGASYGDALTALASAYYSSDAIHGWNGHYQGGPIGFAQREFEIAPGQTESRWYTEPIAAGHAIAWNPSLPGGAKAEDTYVIESAGGTVRRLTDAPGWPVEDSDDRRPLDRQTPAILEVST
ncbi:MAG TPA: M24 family metallopeptidase [Streptosporangiaceae bacterium]